MIYEVEFNFDSNKEFISTSWKETADSEFYMYVKLEMILNYWLTAICPFVKLDNIKCKSRKEEAKIKYELLQFGIELLNRDNTEGDLMRKCELKIKCGDNIHSLSDINIF